MSTEEKEVQVGEEKMTKVILTKEAIFQASDIHFEEVPVPEWGGVARLRILPGNEREDFEQLCQHRQMGKGAAKKMDIHGMKVELLSRCLVDEENNRIFAEKDREDLKLLNKKNGKVLDDLFKKACEMNGIGPEAEAEIEKN